MKFLKSISGKVELSVLLIVTFLAIAAGSVYAQSKYRESVKNEGALFATTATQKVAFHGAAPVVQRAGASQAAVSTNALAVAGTYSQAEVTAIATRAAALTTLVNELRAALVEKGLIRGTTN